MLAATTRPAPPPTIDIDEQQQQQQGTSLQGDNRIAPATGCISTHGSRTDTTTKCIMQGNLRGKLVIFE
jgi:hypothetical protein